jgi:hypothetical protein
VSAMVMAGLLARTMRSLEGSGQAGTRAA